MFEPDDTFDQEEDLDIPSFEAAEIDLNGIVDGLQFDEIGPEGY